MQRAPRRKRAALQAIRRSNTSVYAYCGAFAPSQSYEQLSLQFQVTVLDLRVKLKRILANFAAEARLLVTAERRDRIDHPVAVDPYRAGLELASDLVRAADVAGPDCGRQPVVGVVTLKNRVVFIFERNGRGNRAKDFLARDPHVVIHIRKHGRFDEVALAASSL